VVHAIITI